MARYRIRDVILSEVLGRDYYLPEDRNSAEDVLGGVHVKFTDAQASRLHVEAEGRPVLGWVDLIDGRGEAYIALPPEPLPVAVLCPTSMAVGVAASTPLIAAGAAIAFTEASRKL